MACRRTTCDCAFAHADVSGRLDCQAVQSKVQMVRGKKWDAAGKAAGPAPVILVVILLLHLVILLLLLVILAPAAPAARAAHPLEEV